jgi:hypothetical protein
VSNDTKLDHSIDVDALIRRTDAFLATHKNEAAETLPALQPTGAPAEAWRDFIDAAGNTRTTDSRGLAPRQLGPAPRWSNGGW